MFVIVCLMFNSSVNCETEYDDFEEFDDKIYDKIAEVLREMYPNNLKLANCMVDSMKHRQIAQRFYSIEIMEDRKKLQTEVEIHAANAKLSCNTGEFVSPAGNENKETEFTNHPKIENETDSFITSTWGIIIICIVVASCCAVGYKIYSIKSKRGRIPNSDLA